MPRRKPDPDGWVRTPSSNLYQVRWYRSEEGVDTLEVEFLSGRIYRYDGVPKRLYDGLLCAFSHGSYFHWKIKLHYPGVPIN